MIPAVGGLAARALGTTAGRAAAGGGAAGLTGGVLLDDVPILRNLDPTNNPDGGGNQTVLLLVGVLVGVVLLMQVMDS